LCRRYGVTRAGFYAWQRRRPSPHARDDARLLERVRAVFTASGGRYGAPRIHALLQQSGHHLGRKRVARLMREAGLRARAARLYRRTGGTRSFFTAIPHRLPAAPTRTSDQVWVGDITWIRLGTRWRYLAAVMDRHSRRVLGWSFAAQRDLALTLAALNRALLRRRPPPGLVFHSDRGTEYSAYAYRARLAAHGIVQSMNRPRGLTDNAFIESFWHSLKAEIIHGHRFGSDAELHQAIARFMRHYNRHRPHSALGYRAPIDYERVAA
jgi:transposase InsO family protein